MIRFTKTVTASAVIACAAAATLAFSGPGQAEPNKAPTFMKNAAGLTYGSALKVSSPDAEPDLILVVATNGREGYVFKSGLDEASGSNVRSPKEAVAWQARTEGKTVSLPVYEADGKTKVGQFVMRFPTAAERAAADSAAQLSPPS